MNNELRLKVARPPRSQLPDAAELTLITDGILEARASDGELFGFERSRLVSLRSAEQIAAEAQSFGQEDDITVVRLRVQEVSDEPGVSLEPACFPV